MILEGIDDYMLPCLTKKYLGFDCFGCGMQRAAAFLFNGEFVAAFKMYPAIYPLILLVLFLLLNMFISFKHSERIKIILILVTIVFIVGNFILKLIYN
jgi:hypothetical protein